MDEEKQSLRKPSKNETPERATWTKSWDFIFSCAGMMVGFGNVWRFPYLCFQNGGGAFLIPYMLCAVFLAFPLVYLEISFGQSIRKGLQKSWGTIPILRGIAFCSMMEMVYGTAMYAIIFTWVIKYLVHSFSSVLPWTSCNNSWNTEFCVDFYSNHTNDNLSFSFNISLNYNFNSSLFEGNNSFQSNRSTSSSEEYLKQVLPVFRGPIWQLLGHHCFSYSVWGLSQGIENIGILRTDLACYLVIMWTLTFLAIFRGIDWSAKIVYVTATAPILLIIVALVRGLTLDGAADGIKYYLFPKLEPLANPKVWVKACAQVFYSNVLGSGCLLTLGSFNKRDHNFQRDSIIIIACNCLVSFLAGFAVFSVLGFMAKHQNATVGDVVQSGPGLVFVAYPQALSLLPFANFWCALFFIMLLLLGFDSLYVYVESLQTFFLDYFPQIRKQKYGRATFSACVCCFFCLVGLTMVTEGGVYVFEMFNQYGAAGWCLFLVCFFEFIAIGWCYGTEKHWKQINRMIGPSRFRLFMTIIWKYLGPVVCLTITVYYLTDLSLLSYKGYVYPRWAQWIANLLSLSVVVMIPMCAVYECFTKNMNCTELMGESEDDGQSVEEICSTPLFEKNNSSVANMA